MLGVWSILALVWAGEGDPASWSPGMPADRDGDGLSDHEEVYVWATDPDRADSDGDGLADGFELWRTGSDGRPAPLDPLQRDTDHDGLGDGMELALGCDPASADTDGDGLTDGEEVEGHGWTASDPRYADTDEDGLSDAAEVRVYETDPRRADTDGDGRWDGAEVEAGSDPRRPDVFGSRDPLERSADPERAVTGCRHVGAEGLGWWAVLWALARRRRS